MAQETDILVSGGGIAGLTAALAFSHAGFSVVCVDPGPAPTDIAEGHGDTRTTAFLQPAKLLLERMGVWPDLIKSATPLEVMAIADLNGEGEITAHRAFRASEVSDQPFAWNLANHTIRMVLSKALMACENATYLTKTSTVSMLARDSSASVRLSDGSKIKTRLVVAADGRNSVLRDAANTNVLTARFGQKALVFTVAHEADHDFTSTEIHRTGGPFTLVPLPSDGANNRSSVVWMESGPEAARLAALDPNDFKTAVNERSGDILGHLTPLSTPRVWPIISQRAEKLTAQRLALIAEAAHVVPPIGAQGLNMSLRDISTLCDLACGHRADLGGDAMLDAYSKTRAKQIRARIGGIDALNRASMTEATIMRDLRAEALKLIHDVKPVRQGLMHLGLGK